MSLPSFQQLMFPTLVLACQRLEEVHVSRIEEELARTLRIPADEIGRLAPSGKQTTFANRLNWARCYLLKAGLHRVDAARIRQRRRARAQSAGVKACGR